VTLDLRPDMDAIFGALAAPTVVDGAPTITTTVIVRSPSAPSPADGALQGYRAVQPLKEATFLKADVAQLPARSRIVITDGADAGTYVTGELVKEDGETFVVTIAPVDA